MSSEKAISTSDSYIDSLPPLREDILHIRRFTGEREDFQRWKRDFTHAMKMEGLEIWLKDNKTKNAFMKAKQITQEELVAINGMIFGMIRLAVSEDISTTLHARYGEDGFASWNHLIEEYEEHDSTQLRELGKKLNELTLRRCSRMELYLKQFMSLMEQMKKAGKVMTDRDMLMELMEGLPAEYDFWVFQQHMKYKPNVLVDIQAIVDELLMLDSIKFRRGTIEAESQEQSKHPKQIQG
jgi:hypothetical protein